MLVNVRTSLKRRRRRKKNPLPQVGQAPHFISDSIIDSISERQIREAKKSKLRMTGQPQL